MANNIYSYPELRLISSLGKNLVRSTMEKSYSFIGNYRLKKVKEDNIKVNWLFLPGGPGMGSEYLNQLVTNLDLPGTLIIGDFPGDGSNRNLDEINYEYWKSGLIEVLNTLTPCILVTHSFSGMFALTVPELENILKGLVIINSAPSHNWQKVLADTATTYNLPNITNEVKALYNNPTDEQLKLLFQATIPYLFLQHEVQLGNDLLEISAYNVKTRIWADQYFHKTYTHSWIPNMLPTLIIGSHDDRLLPIKLFLQDEEWLRQNIKIVELRNTGHFPWLSYLTLVNEKMLDFVNM